MLSKRGLLFRCIVIALAILSLCGCAKKDDNTTTSSPSTQPANVAQAKTSEPASASTAVPAESDNDTFKPTKDITFVVGFDVGGTADIPARIIAKYMSKYAGVNVNVTNIIGSSGRVAADRVMKGNVDNHTLLHVPVGYYMQAALGQANFTYKDFEPVTLWCDSWVGLVVNADSPYQTYEEFVQAAKDNPGQLRLGTVAGTLPQLASLAIADKEGIELNMVDIGTNNKATELMGKRIDGYIDGIGQFKQYVDSGDFRCLMAFGLSGSEFPGYPGLPAAEDLGYSNIEYLLQSFGMWAPKGTSPAAIEYYSNLIKTVSEDPECQAELNALGYGTTWMDTADYTEMCGMVLDQTTEAIEVFLTN